MRLLLDTCVISEYIKSKPNQIVIDWLDQQNETELFISIISIAEIQKGIFKIQDSQPQRALQLNAWLFSLEEQFSGRILEINSQVLKMWAEINGISEAKGKKLPIIDSLIAATAAIHKATIVTRNTQDFQFISISTLNPWDKLYF